MKISIIVSIAALLLPTSGAALLWAHSHGEKPIIANKTHISALASVSRMNQNIRYLGRRCHDLSMMIERKRSDLIQIELSPNKDPRIIELKGRIQREIEGYQKLLEQQEQRLRDIETKETELISRVAIL